jgi:hypothetical protein
MESPVFARYNFGDIVLTDEERASHVYIIGRSGTGKSTVLYNVAVADILTSNDDTGRPRGIAVVDPHGDLIDQLIDTIPPWRTNDVVVIDAGDTETAVGFNPVANVAVHDRHLAAAGVVEAFKSLFANSWSSRIEAFFYNGVRLLLDLKHPTLYELPRIYDDPKFRAVAIARATDPSILRFWTSDYPSYPERYREEAAGPIKQRLGQAISSPPVRGILCQRHPRFDLATALERGQIVFLKLSQIGRQPANLLGSLFMSHLQQCAMRRSAGRRSPYSLIIDEFERFGSEVFCDLMSEARKYGLMVTAAHQHTAQLSDSVRAAMLSAGTIICFRLSAADAELISLDFAPLPPEELADQGKGRAWIKRGFYRQHVAIETLPAQPCFTARSATVLDQSRRAWARTRFDIDKAF